jgi:4-alpha-glucanotransferase
VDDYLGHSQESMPWPMIRAALASHADLAVVPMQDLMGLDGEHRMNRPGVPTGNWRWRFQWDQLDAQLAQRIKHLIALYGRLQSVD